MHKLQFSWFPTVPDLVSWVPQHSEELALDRPHELPAAPEVRCGRLKAI